MILSEGPHLGDEVNLIVDVGTNAEIVLGNRDRLLAASSPTGPAFEGAQISCGQRAAPGAIERVRIDPRHARAALPRDRHRRLVERAGLRRAPHVTRASAARASSRSSPRCTWPGSSTTDGVIDGSLAARTPRIVADGRTFSYVLSRRPSRALAITQNDVRAIQLAKAALHAGCTLLIEHYGIERVDRIRLAGAFGNHIDPVHALVLGLVPDCDPAHVRSAGNAAGTGARIALLDRAARAEIEAAVRRVEKIETAIEPRFQELFVGAMAIPHDVDPYERLRAAVRAAAAPRRRAARPTAAAAVADPLAAKEHRMTDTHAAAAAAAAAPARQAARAVTNADQRPLHHARAEAVRGALATSTSS